MVMQESSWICLAKTNILETERIILGEPLLRCGEQE